MGEAIVGLAMLVFIYFVPSFIAEYREHHNKLAIVMLNIFGGLIGVGWLVALVWSCTAVKPELRSKRS